ncbi:hypothetical protein MOQ72_19985 [Saccharopolyspora sp. K220]|uniref:hypothetical protein n=1 Tax=Saccharopolyspora soli TaxID=2926618 RepID=UPI001F5A47D2|nr:hypothetical protein [Saccharopolyspora soli]MCI2419730.1 hypothetical protein [Saccharopolyspora soli]
MGTDQSVRCEVPYFPAAGVGFGLMWIVGLVYVGLQGPSHPGYPWDLLVFFGLLLLTVCGGLIRSRHVVRAVEFTESQVRLERRADVRTVHIANVRAVWIEHTGDTASGYQETSLRLEWRGGSKSVVCYHDPALGQALLRLLPSHVAVKERWDQLREPSTG